MEAPEQIKDILTLAKLSGKHYKFDLNNNMSGARRATSCSFVWPGRILPEDASLYIEDIEEFGFICLRIKDEDWIIWDPAQGDPSSAFKKHRRSQSDQKVSKKRSKNKKTKRSGKKRSTKKTSKRRV